MAGSAEVGMEEELQKKDMGPLIVRFPRKVPVVEPVKLEYEDDEAGTGAADSKPRNMIQVRCTRISVPGCLIQVFFPKKMNYSRGFWVFGFMCI